MTTDRITLPAKDFFRPLLPLREAIVTFFQTTIGIVLGLIMIICIVIKLTFVLGHHRMDHRPDHGRNYEIRQQQAP